MDLAARNRSKERSICVSGRVRYRLDGWNDWPPERGQALSPSWGRRIVNQRSGPSYRGSQFPVRIKEKCLRVCAWDYARSCALVDALLTASVYAVPVSERRFCVLPKTVSLQI